MRLVLTFFLACLVAAPAIAAADHPRWAVRVSSDGHAYFLDEPNCHPLAYFVNDTSRLNYHHIIVKIQRGQTKDEASSRDIGEVDRRKIIQVSHKIDDGELFLKMIVAERATGELCEIYHQEWLGDGFYNEVLPVDFVKVDSQTVLVTADPVSGNGNWFDEHYWTFDKDGPIDLCVSEKIREIEKQLLPKDASVMKGGGFDLRALAYSTPVWKETDGGCCPSGGMIEIKFALKDHQLVVLSQNFKSN
jgi:hypothetical protein